MLILGLAMTVMAEIDLKSPDTRPSAPAPSGFRHRLPLPDSLAVSVVADTTERSSRIFAVQALNRVLESSRCVERTRS
jgi:hypothetical protein